MKEDPDADNLFFVVFMWVVTWTGFVLTFLFVSGVFGYNKHDTRSSTAVSGFLMAVVMCFLLFVTIMITRAFIRTRPRQKDGVQGVNEV